jgi:hypothetical protein
MSTVSKNEADLADAAVRACIHDICHQALNSPEAKRRIEDIYDAFCVTHSAVKLNVATSTSVDVAGVQTACAWKGLSLNAPTLRKW